MTKYTIKLIVIKTLDERIVEAESKADAIKKSFLTFEKFDRDVYDDIVIEEIEDKEDEK